MKSLAGKAVVITGSGSGIGAATAVLAAAEGARVVVNDIRADAAERVADDIRQAGNEAVVHVADIATWEGAAGLIQACVRAFGTIDGLVNNAGLHYLASVDEETEADVGRMIQVNVLGTMYCGLLAIREMKKHSSGAIVNTTSGAHAGITLMGAYGASKGAVASLTYSWAIDLAATGIRVNAISPMAGRSPNGYHSSMSEGTNAYFKARGLPLWPLPTATPEDNAPVSCYLLSDRSRAINGQLVRIDGKRLSLMTHPAALHPVLERPEWTVDSMADVFDSDLGKRQQPLGVVTMEAVVRPYGLAYPSPDKS